MADWVMRAEPEVRGAGAGGQVMVSLHFIGAAGGGDPYEGPALERGLAAVRRLPSLTRYGKLARQWAELAAEIGLAATLGRRAEAEIDQLSAGAEDGWAERAARIRADVDARNQALAARAAVLKPAMRAARKQATDDSRQALVRARGETAAALAARRREVLREVVQRLTAAPEVGDLLRALVALGAGIDAHNGAMQGMLWLQMDQDRKPDPLPFGLDDLAAEVLAEQERAGAGEPAAAGA